LGLNPELHDKRHVTVVKIYIVVLWVIKCYPLLGDKKVLEEKMYFEYRKISLF
jgi:hypothetical protein